MEARYEQEEEQTHWMKVRDRFQQRLERWYRQAQRMDTDHGHKEESSYGDGRTRWMNIHAHKEEESYPYEQKGEWPRRQAQWSGHSPYAGYENLWGKWLNVHGPYGRKQPFVMSLIRKGINFNDLKPDSYRRFDLNCPDTNSLAEAEHRMREWKLSVEDLKQGTFYSALENGRNLYGEKISKEDGLRMIDQINNDYKNDYKKELNGKMEVVDHDDQENVDYSRVKRRSKTKHHKRSKAKHAPVLDYSRVKTRSKTKHEYEEAPVLDGVDYSRVKMRSKTKHEEYEYEYEYGLDGGHRSGY